jgi:hypothetical protein
MGKSLGINPETLFDFVISPFDEKMNALPSPNLVIATPSDTNESNSSQLTRQVQHIEEERLSPVRKVTKIALVEEFQVGSYEGGDLENF